MAGHVLTKAIIASCGGIGLIRTCACQYGPCGHCGAGRHQHCAHRVRSVLRSSEGSILSRAGHVLARWDAGRRCQWLCPCCGVRKPPVVAERPARAPAHSRPVVVVERPTLF